ncbi:MAG: glycosyltransferase family 4 protein [Candidatus Binatia bacterium]
MAALSLVHVDAERGYSGGEVQVLLLIAELSRRGHRNVLICPPASAVGAAAAARGIAVRAISMRSDLDLLAVPRLVGALRAARPDAVHLHTGRAAWLGGLAAYWARVPAIVTRRMDRPVHRSARTRLIYGQWTQRTAAISAHVGEQLAAAGVARRRIAVIPDAIDTARVQTRRGRAALRAAEGAADADVVLLSAAALVARKGGDVLLDALAHLGRAGLRPRVWFAGEGPERAALIAHADRLGLGAQVRWLGQRDDMGDLLAAADAVVVPSRAEGLGVIALEAMAAGRPVIASAVGGLRDAIGGERTGLLVPPGDPAALATAVARIITDAELRGRLGAAGPAEVAQRFLPGPMADAYERLYAEARAEWERRAD